MPEGTVSVGHPVDVASGAVFTLAHDFELPGTLPLRWTRYYSTVSLADTILGLQWSNPLLICIDIQDDGLHLNGEDGSRNALGGTHPDAGPQTLVDLAANIELTLDARAALMVHWHHGDEDIDIVRFERSSQTRYRVVSYENHAGHALRLGYDARGRLSSIHQTLENRRVRLVYEQDERLAGIDQVLDDGSARRLVTYEHSEGRLTRATNCVDATVGYRYDRHGRMVGETSELGATFRFEYDRQGRCVHTAGDGGYLERRLQFHDHPKRTLVTDTAGDVTTYYLNAAGQVIQQVSPSGSVLTTDYDEFGRVVRTRFPDGGAKSCEYDTRGNRCRIVDPMGAETRIEFDSRHLVTAITDALGATTRLTRDSAGLHVGTTNPNGASWRYARDANGLVRTATSPEGLSLQLTYGPDMRSYQLRDQFGVIRFIEFDQSGNPVRVHDAGGLVRTLFHDARGRRIRSESSNGHAVEFEWNASDQIVVRRSSTGELDRWEYDKLGFMLRHINPLGHTHELRYDLEGRLKAVRNRNGEISTLEYDRTGSLSREVTFDGRQIRYDNRIDGFPTRVTSPDGSYIEFKYDLNGMLLAREGSDGIVETYAYDALGQIVEANSPDCNMVLKRDISGNIIAESQNGKSVLSQFDREGRRISRQIETLDHSRLEFEYDVRGRVTSVRHRSGVIQANQWDARDRLQQRSVHGVATERFSYDAADRIVSHQMDVEGSTVERAYAWSPNDLLTGERDTDGRQWTYEHDALGRLILVSVNGRPRERFSLDPNGSIVADADGPRTTGPGGRLFETTTERFEYDANGCVVAMHGALAPARELEFDVEGQLRQVRVGAKPLASYGYDATGRRSHKLTDAGRTTFVWDGATLAASLDEDGEATIFWHDGLVPAGQIDNERVLHYVTDPRGVVRDCIDERGLRYPQPRLSAFGEQSDSSAKPITPFRMLGQYRDDETGLHYNLRRYCNPRTGDFLSPDPLGLEAGTHAYEYPRNPIDWDDPFGLSCSRHKEKIGERRMEEHYTGKGYKRLTQPPTKRARTQGVDAVYHKPGGNPEYIIVECKYGKSELKTTTHSGEQLSNQWLNSPVDPGGKLTRLQEAVGKDQAKQIYAAGAQGLVARDAFYAPAGAPREIYRADDPYRSRGPASQNGKVGDMTKLKDDW